MPQIREYQTQTSESGSHLAAGASAEDFGGGIGAASAEIGRAIEGDAQVLQKREQQEEVSGLHAKIAKAHADFTAQLQDGLQKGSLDSGKFIQGFDDTMSKLSDDISTPYGKNYFGEASAQLRMHLMDSALVGQAHIAGQKAVANFQDGLTSSSNALINDPSSFDIAKQNLHQMVQGLIDTGGLPAAKAPELIEHGEHQLAKAASRGWIELNPQAAKGIIDKNFGDVLNGDEKYQMYQEADQHVRAQEAESLRVQALQEKAEKKAREETQNNFLKKMQDGSLGAKEVLQSNLEAFGSGSKEQFIQMLNKDGNKTDPAVFRDLFNRIHLPDGDPRKITDDADLNQHVVAGDLSYQDLEHLRGEVQGKGTEAGKAAADLRSALFKQAEDRLVKKNPMIGMTDPQGEEQFAKFKTLFYDEYQKQKKAGKSDMQLLSPSSPDYLGKVIDNFVKSPQQLMQDNLRAAGIAPAGTPSHAPVGAPGAQTPKTQTEPRKQGESAEDYLKRTGR